MQTSSSAAGGPPSHWNPSLPGPEVGPSASQHTRKSMNQSNNREWSSIQVRGVSLPLRVSRKPCDPVPAHLAALEPRLLLRGLSSSCSRSTSDVIPTSPQSMAKASMCRQASSCPPWKTRPSAVSCAEPPGALARRQVSAAPAARRTHSGCAPAHGAHLVLRIQVRLRLDQELRHTLGVVLGGAHQRRLASLRAQWRQSWWICVGVSVRRAAAVCMRAPPVDTALASTSPSAPLAPRP